MITPGQALALGNLAQPQRSQPITNAILRKQNLDLAREEKKAKELADKQRQEAELAKLLQFGEGGFSPHFQEQATKIITRGISDQLTAKQQGDALGVNMSANKMNRDLEDLKLQDENYKKFIGLKKEGYLIPQEIENALGEGYSTGSVKVKKFLNDNPQYKSIISIDDKTGNYIYNPIKSIDLAKSYDAAIRENEGQMTQSKFIRNVDQNTSLHELSLAPGQITNIASGLASDPDYVANAKIKYPEKFNKILSEMAGKFPEVTGQKLESAAAVKIFEDELMPRNKKVHFETKPQPVQTPAYNRTPDQLFTKTPMTIGGSGGREAFNKKHKTNYSQNEWAEMGGLESGETTEYIAINPKSGNADTESIQLSFNGKPFKPQGYKVRGNKVFATGALTDMVKTGKFEDTNTVDENGKPVYQEKTIEKFVPKKDVPLSDEDLADVASHYHFDDVGKFIDWISVNKPNAANKNGSNSKNSTGKKQIKGF